MRAAWKSAVIGGALAVSVVTTPSLAATINSTAQGSYNGPGSNFSGGGGFSNNINAGAFQVQPVGSTVFSGSYRNYFTFDLSSLAGQSALAATLTIFASNGTYTGNATETYQVNDFVGSIGNLVGGSGGVAAFNDLGSGDVYGQAIVNGPNGPMPLVSIVLSVAAIADINTLLGGANFAFAIGGSCTTCSANQFLWGSSGSVIPAARLSIDLAEVSAVPIPAALPLLASGLGGMGLLGWWRRRRRA